MAMHSSSVARHRQTDRQPERVGRHHVDPTKPNQLRPLPATLEARQAPDHARARQVAQVAAKVGRAIGRTFLTGSIRVDAAIGRTAEETAKFLWRHRIGTAHTVGTLGALTGAVLVTDNLLNLNISERMTDLAYAATGQAVSGKAGTGSAKGLLAGSGLVAGGMFANLQGMVMSASRDSRERSEREAGLGIFGDYDEVTYETVPTEVEADTTTPVAVAPEVAVAALEEETVKLPVVPSSTPESAAQSLSFTWFNASGATRELELVGANNA